jgi:hypothetical protein
MKKSKTPLYKETWGNRVKLKALRREIRTVPQLR